MTTLDLVRSVLAHKLWLRWAYARGIYNEWDLRDEAGERVADPIAIRRQRVRELAKNPARAVRR